MSETKPNSSTPGPWKTYGGPGRLHHCLAVIDSIPDVDGKVMANCICHVATTNPHSDANARLIAHAPELLEACRAVLDAIERADLGGEVLWINRGSAVHESATDRLQDVIEKATGNLLADPNSR